MQRRKICLFVHGFLGDNSDWDSLINSINYNHRDVQCIALPMDITVQWNDDIWNDKLLDLDFEKALELSWSFNLKKTSESIINSISNIILSTKRIKKISIYLIGYSLGARVLMQLIANISDKKNMNQHIKQNIKQIILISGNPGLRDINEKLTRWKSDQAWAKKFVDKKIELETILNQWYSQKVFAGLDNKNSLIAKRKNISASGKMLAYWILSHSLALQDNLENYLYDNKEIIDYLAGEQDSKFVDIAQYLSVKFNIRTYIIQNASHMTHMKNPDLIAEHIIF